MSAPGKVAQANKRLAGKLFLLTVAMFGFGYALVPLYRVFCELTGLNGTTGRADVQAVQASQVDTSRWITVEFTGQAMGSLPWEFRPLQAKVRVHPGGTAMVKYYARNMSGDAIVARAVPSVAPNKAARYFKKVECFCFSEQELKGGESQEMPVTFLVERDIPKDVDTLTLSYAFYYLDKSKTVQAEDDLRLPRPQRDASTRAAAPAGAS
jgi:cytochrome c oxidase assembly protein subunit 11